MRYEEACPRNRRQEKADPIALARDNWERSGRGEVADGMVAVTVMRAHQILLARASDGAAALRPELLALRAAAAAGVQPQAAHCRSPRRPTGCRCTSPASRMRSAAGGQRAGGADPASDRRPHHVGADTELAARRSRTTVTLNNEVFADIGMSDDESRTLARSIETLRRRRRLRGSRLLREQRADGKAPDTPSGNCVSPRDGRIVAVTAVPEPGRDRMFSRPPTSSARSAIDSRP